MSRLEDHQSLTRAHITASSDNYKPCLPSKTVKSVSVPIPNPTNQQFQYFKNKLVEQMETKCNNTCSNNTTR